MLKKLMIAASLTLIFGTVFTTTTILNRGDCPEVGVNSLDALLKERDSCQTLGSPTDFYEYRIDPFLIRNSMQKDGKAESRAEVVLKSDCDETETEDCPCECKIRHGTPNWLCPLRYKDVPEITADV